MAFVVAETLEQAHEWWVADILWYRRTEGSGWTFGNCCDPTCGEPGIDNNPDHYGIQLED